MKTTPIQRIEVTCPHCGRLSRTPRENIGKDAKCRCGRHFVVQELSSLAPAPQAAQLESIPEETIYEGPSSQWTNLPAYIGYALLACIGIPLRYGLSMSVGELTEFARWLSWAPAMLAAILAAKAWWRVRFLVYCVTNECVEVERGLISKHLDNLDMFRVTDIMLTIRLTDRIVGIGNVVLCTTDKTNPTLTIRGIPAPRRVYDRLKREAIRADRRHGVLHMET